jgi:glycosyltransferase involved in cell wall biosynthesis
LKLKNELKINWIADLRDPWTDIYYYDQLYHTSIAKKIDRNYERKVLVESDKVIVVSDAIKKQFLTKDAAIKSSKFSIIPNGFDESDFTDKPIRDENRFIITYTGTIAPNYNIESFLKAVLRLHEETNDDRILLRFVGVVADHFKNLIENTNLQQCTEFIGHVKHSRSIQYLNQSAILFLAIPDVQHNKGILTGKLFEYLGSRKPIVGVGPVDGDAARIISECRAGKMYNYHDQDKLFDYLMLLYNQWLQNKQLISSEKVISYSRKRLTEKLVSLLHD